MAVNELGNIFVTFGAGRSGWIGAAKRITAEAEETGLFEFCFNLDENWLKTWDPTIYEIGLDLRKNQPPRGFGYWTWKPSVLMWAHLNFPNHQIVYVDAGSEFCRTKKSFATLQKYLDDSYKTGGLVWQLPNHPEICWTKKDLFTVFTTSEKVLMSNQIQSGFIALPPSHSRSTLLSDWRLWAVKQMGFYFTDQLKEEPNMEFQEHRHDQSILSLLWKEFELPLALDMTSPPESMELGLRSSRNNSRLTSDANPLLKFVFKYFYLAKDYIFGKDDRRLRN